MQVNGEGNRVEGNFIGTDPGGTGPVANGRSGVRVFGPENVIGGDTLAARNVISGNAAEGIFVGNSAQQTAIRGNCVGVGATGAAVPNGGDGVGIRAAPSRRPSAA